MKLFLVYSHPCKNSFTKHVCDSFLSGVFAAGHSVEVSDLYEMGFQTDISEAEYLRESDYRRELPIPVDVQEEQRKINNADGIAFIYPVFWTEAPAKLVGWFDRVWTYGFAYGENRTMKQLQKALFLCVAGNTEETLEQQGRIKSMRNVMLDDRIHDRAMKKDLVVLGGTEKNDMTQRMANWDKHLQTAYTLGKDFFKDNQNNYIFFHCRKHNFKQSR